MAAVVGLLTFVVGLVFAVVTHEAGHYLAMRAEKIPIVEAAIGLRRRPMARLRVRGVTVTVSPWLLAAHVGISAQSREELAASPFWRRAAITNAGSTANLVCCLLLAGLYGWTVGEWRAGWISIGLAVVLTACWRLFAAFVAPVLSIAAVVAVGMWVASGLTSVGGGRSENTGALPAEFGLGWLLATLAGVSLVVAVANLLPMWPTDNARVLEELARRWSPALASRFRAAGVWGLVGLLATTVMVDVLWLSS